ncbi:MAG: universal stress protein [Piscinibacter sp.]|nr:universal stress protein [Piscinibacter sp.]
MKTILVHADATAQAPMRLKLAEQLAAAHGAAATALYAATSALTRYPMALAAGGEIGSTLVELDRQRRTAAQAQFKASVDARRMAWREGAGLPVADLVQHAWYTDLLLLGQHPPGPATDVDVPADFVSSVILDSGRPALVVPAIPREPTPLRRVLIAWKATRESARAVSAALPLLQQANHVQVVAFDEGEGLQAESGIVDYLRAHGVGASLQRDTALRHELGEQLLSLAADEQADLLVMGCYGHGRAREWALGGATRTVLQSMTLPVLFCH